MSWVPVTSKPRFLAWTGSNLAEWQERWPNAWIENGKLFYGPTIGPVDVGGGIVEGAGINVVYFTAAEFAENFTVDAPAAEPAPVAGGDTTAAASE